MTKHLNIKSVQSIQIAILAMLIWSIFISQSRAAEISFDSTQAPQATKAVANETEPTQPANNEPQDFLNERSPLSTPTLSTAKAKDQNRTCSSSGDALSGSQNCMINVQGNRIETNNDWEVFGDEKKEQIVTRHLNSKNETESENAFRIKTHYRTSKDNVQQKEFELYDIVDQPARGLITRDLVVKQFDSKGLLKKVTWAHYNEISDGEAGLEHHAVLYYEDGKLTSGYADKYKNGKVVDTLLNFDPLKNPNLRLEKTGILKWSSWIDHLLQTSPAVI